MNETLFIIEKIFNSFFLIFSIVIFLTYIIMAIISAIALFEYIQKNRSVDYSVLLSSPFTPSISVIAPAFNEGKSIIENTRALLSLYYNDFEIIIVNDGSTDDSFDKIVKAYDLIKVDYYVNMRLKTKNIRGIYKSTNKSFQKLTFIDKENGGKFDALNAGINVSKNDLFVAIDVDSIIESDALLKLVKPFTEETDKKIIATGGVIRIVNDCEIIDGQIVKINLPKKIWTKIQVLEYTRAFLMGRMAWSKLDGLLLISGALGMFNREIVIESGGYADTVGEDMELIVRIRRYMVEQNQKYKVEYIPDPLCWTEAPENLKILGRQRNRWARGTIDTLRIHKKIFFNKKYGKMGMLGYPYWFFFEWLASLFEALGLMYLIVLIVLDRVNWNFLFLMFIFVYSFAIAFSSWALLYEELTFRKYKRKTDLLKLYLTALIEPIIYHPISVFFSLKGNIDYFRGKTGWGEMKKTGFKKK